MADTSKGFRFVGRKSGGTPTIQNIVCAATATLTAGDMVYLSSGQLVLGATNQSTMLGVCLETKAGTAGVTKYRVIVDSDAIYAVYDNNARTKDTALDLSGATGAQTVTTDTNDDFVVFATKQNASDPTLVCFNVGVHIDTVNQT